MQRVTGTKSTLSFPLFALLVVVVVVDADVVLVVAAAAATVGCAGGVMAI